MNNENKGIDVFQDGEITPEPEIFKDYSNTPAPKGTVSKSFAITAIIAAILVLMMVAGAFVGGFFFAKSKGIESDMPMLEEAYEIVKKYYYEDITWDEFQRVATKQFIMSLDKYAYMVDADQPSGKMTAGFSTTNDLYGRHVISDIVKNSPIDRAEAVNYCENPVYQEQPSKFTYVNYSTLTNAASEHMKIELGDKLVAVSFNSNAPIYVEGLSTEYVSAIVGQSDDLILYIAKSNGEGQYLMSGVYQFNITKEFVKTKYAFLYTPAEIGDSTGTTALIKFTSFSGSAVEDFYNCVKTFKESGYTHLILDLRNNGGGNADILEYIAGCLIKGADEKNLDIIYFEQNKGNGKFEGEYNSTVKSYQYDNGEEIINYEAINLVKEVENFKMTVLCNGNTASSSEALIGALLFYNNIEIIGSKTYGKGIGQIIYPFGEYYLYIPNGKYYIPTDDGSGKAQWTTCIHGVGISPSEENIIDSVVRPIETDKAIARALTLLND